MIRYTHPQLFFLFIPFFIVVIWYAFRGKQLRNRLESIGTEKIRTFLLNRVKLSRVRLRSRLIIVAILFLILSSVGPQIGTKLKELNRKGVDVIVAIDTSTSMDAIDISPSRLEKAKLEISSLINQLDGDRVGLIVFAGTAHLHCPLTSDYSASRLFLSSINSHIVHTQGTDLASALELALENIPKDEESFKVILLVSDGEDHQGRIADLVDEANSRGIIVHTLGMGTLNGGPIPITDINGNRKDFKKDKNGKIITSKLDGSTLSSIASKTGGKYVRVGNESNAILPIISQINDMENRELKSHIFSQYEDRYQIFLLIALILFVAEFFISTRTQKESVWQGRFSK